MKGKILRWEFDGNCIRCLSHKANRDGYPKIQRHREPTRTIARHILFKKFGVQPNYIVCRHTCDHEWCINPDHVIAGTQQQNVADRVSRGRTVSRTKTGYIRSELSEDKIRTIREMRSEGIKQATIARMFNIHQSNVSLIVSRRTWSHL